MTKIGHETPLLDNFNRADLTPHAVEAQMRIGQEVPEPDVVPEELPLALRLTEKQEARVSMLMETQGLDRLTAILYSVSPSKARRIINHALATKQLAIRNQGIEQRRQEEVPPGPSVEELVALLRDTLPKDPDSPTEPTSRAA